jgi:hypothetical protein
MGAADTPGEMNTDLDARAIEVEELKYAFLPR